MEKQRSPELPTYVWGIYFYKSSHMDIQYERPVMVPVINHQTFTGAIGRNGSDELEGILSDPAGESFLVFEKFTDEEIVFTKRYITKHGILRSLGPSWRYELKKDPNSPLWVGIWKNPDTPESPKGGIAHMFLIPPPMPIQILSDYRECLSAVEKLFPKDEIPFSPNPPQVEIPPEGRDEIFGTKAHRESYMAEIDAITGGDPEFFEKEIAKDAQRLRRDARHDKKTPRADPPAIGDTNEKDDLPF
ncbi:MAG: hypothetical protein HGA67_01740 [Candidatus Yonathbacteria bacterium]|nr:hypothetical protein [Candidatus Yonathbacteria bacterium]